MQQSAYILGYGTNGDFGYSQRDLENRKLILSGDVILLRIELNFP